MHYGDKCQNVIEISVRKKILRDEKRCFRCLMAGHILLKNYITSYKCHKCQGKNHCTLICDNTINIDDKKDSKSQKPAVIDSEENEEKVAMLIDAKADLLLQTAECLISNRRETKTNMKVLLDPDSQKTYLSEAVKDCLQLDAITKQNVAIKTFGSSNWQLKELGEFKFALGGLHGNGLRMYMSGFSVPVVSGPVNGQKIDFVKNSIHLCEI